MGGFGSGRHWSSRLTTSAFSQCDVRQWQRDGLLVAGRLFSAGYWNTWDVEVVTTMKRAEPNMVCLRQRGQLCEPYRVRIEWTPCNYGGKRPWFVCPRGCGHRVAILYFSHVRVGCRHCLQLAYDSQQDSGWHRSLRRACSARMKLGGSAILAEPLPGKPKGMHWRTYDRLYARAAEREAVVFGGLARSFLINCERGENS